MQSHHSNLVEQKEETRFGRSLNEEQLAAIEKEQIVFADPWRRDLGEERLGWSYSLN
jgi:hypothetical protein